MKTKNGKIIPMPVELEIDPIVCDIISRIVKGTEPYIREEFVGQKIVASDLSIAIDVTFDHLLRANAAREGIPAKERGKRRRALERSSLELRRMPFRLADSND